MKTGSTVKQTYFVKYLHGENLKLSFITSGSCLLDAEKNDVMKTGSIVKQTYFVKYLHGENLKLLNKIHVNIFHENFRYFSDTFFLYLSFKVKLSHIQ